MYICFAAISRTSNSQYDALITSNLVPMYEEFKSKWLASPVPHWPFDLCWTYAGLALSSDPWLCPGLCTQTSVFNLLLSFL